MIFKCVTNLNIFIYIFLLVFKTSNGQKCSSDGINCISCTEYENCNGAFPKGRVISCKTGGNCADDQLKQCQMKLNCYALNECTQAGIFPDVMVDSNYYVCLNDASTGFLKYEFTCPEGNFFDKASLTCVPREVTSATTEVPSSLSVSADPTSSSASVDPTTTASTGSTSPSTSTDLTSTVSSSTSSSTSSDTTISTGSTSLTSTDLTSSTSTVSTSPSTSIDPSSSTSTTSTSPSSSTDPSSSTSTTSISPSSSTDPTSSTSTISTTPSTSTDPTSSTSTISTTPSFSTSSTSPSTPTTPSPTTMPFICPASGIFPNPDNCKMYYRCSTSLKAFFYICPGNSYFNEMILKCSLTITPACQEQILKNSTSTIPTTTPTVTTTTTVTIPPVSTTTPKPSTSTPTTTTTTTLAPTTPATTTTTSTTTTPPPSTPFSCPMTGIFANPSDCKIYYRCTLSGTIFQYVCPGNTYFNEYTKRCSLVITPRCKNLIQG